MSKSSQTSWVHLQLIAGRKLTALDAFKGCGCLRLAGRIHELRQQGYPIKSRMVKRNTKRVAEYSAA
jgi:hypothetical protein